MPAYQLYCLLEKELKGGPQENMMFKMPNKYVTRLEMKNELSALLNDFTVFTEKDSLMVVKGIMCYKTLEKVHSRVGIMGSVIYRKKTIRGNAICKECKSRDAHRWNRCKHKTFKPYSINHQKVRIVRAKLHNTKMEIKDGKIPEFDEPYFRGFAKKYGFDKARTEWINKEIDEILDGIAKLTGCGREHVKKRRA